MSGLNRLDRARALRLLGVAILATSLIVIFSEFRKPPPKRAGYATPEEGVPPAAEGHALNYSELRQTTRGPSREMYLASAQLLTARLPSLTEPLVRKPGDREQMLEARAARRAYDSAPPTVPHPVDERGIPNCLVCHERGAMIGQLRAPAMSHVSLGSCLQCHAAGASGHGSPVTVSALTADNEFEPLPFGGLGTRAWSGAPPTRPHSTEMRSNCSSCHGVAGAPGLRTSHADRQGCEQCHVGPGDNDLVTPMFAKMGGAL